MKIKKEAFERTIINSEYIGYYTHLLSADTCPYHQGKQLDTMRYLLENDRIEEIKPVLAIYFLYVNINYPATCKRVSIIGRKCFLYLKLKHPSADSSSSH